MRDINSLFAPNSVAVIGASNKPDKVGNMVVKNLISCNYFGNIYPINPKEDIIEGLKVYHSIQEVPEIVDLVIMCIPAILVNETVKQCGINKVKNIILLTAGFKEVGEEGAKLEQELSSICKQYNINLLGPNCLGSIDTHTPLNASFSQLMPNKGNIAFVSQSGAMLVAILDWSISAGIGFSKVISIGNKADLSEIELIQHLADDDTTSVILFYLEGISNGKKFLKVTREVSKKKPIIILKSGSSKAGSKAASSHTGALAGNDSAFDTAFASSGIIRANTMTELFDLGLAFSKSKLPEGNRVAVITNAGGGGVISADSIEKNNLQLAQLSENTIKCLSKCLPAEGNINNPIDVLGDASPQRYKETLEIVSKDENVDSMIVITCPTAAADPVGNGREVLEIAKTCHKPILVVNMGGINFESINEELKAGGIPTYVFPETAVETLHAMCTYSQNRKRSSDNCLNKLTNINKSKVEEIFNNVRSKGRSSLLGSEAYEVAKNYGIPATPTILAHTPDEAAQIATQIGFPVVLKIASDKIMHKTDIGGVRININSETEVKNIFNEIISNAKKTYPNITPDGIEIQKMMPKGQEVIVGMLKDPQFGPIIAFGMGGIYVNLIKDASFTIADGITDEQIEEQIKSTKAYKLLNGFRGTAVCDINSVKDIIKRIAKLTLDFDEIAELDVNPVVVYENEASSLDVKITLKK